MASDNTRESRLWITTDNDNLETSDVVAKGETDGTLRVSLAPGAIGKAKILGTSDPAATTNTNLYTAPASTNTKITKLFAVNRGSTAITIRIGFDVGGAGTNAPSDAEWIVYDLTLDSSQSLCIDGPIWITATDDVVVYASASDASFVLTGVEHL
jgi:hypothetical protein